ncbi:MAG: threonine--tRNA ligase [Polyangiaceae bacterium]
MESPNLISPPNEHAESSQEPQGAVEAQHASLDASDHRALARRMGLFHQEPSAPGMVFWHPAGWQLYRALEGFVRRVMERDGYAEVRSPQLMRRAVWEASGHWAHFRENMFCLGDSDAPDESALKPVSCPGHLSVFKAMVPSYRDLPLRLSEFGLVHRDEAGGALQGLLRLRQFTQDDGHILCAPEQAESEVERFLSGVLPFYRACGFEELAVALSTRPPDRAGSDAEWDQGEALLARVLDRLGWKYVVQPGAGAFYGPKLEFGMRDRQGREWQCGTIQFDLFMPSRFGVAYVASDGSRQRPVMLHRALCGSLERFLGILLEHHAGRLPLWLAPRQVRVLPISEAQGEAAQGLARELRARCIRVDVDLSAESLGRRVALAHKAGVAELVVLGAREVAEDKVALRSGAEQRVLSRQEFLEEISRRGALPDL